MKQKLEEAKADVAEYNQKRKSNQQEQAEERFDLLVEQMTEREEIIYTL